MFKSAQDVRSASGFLLNALKPMCFFFFSQRIPSSLSKSKGFDLSWFGLGQDLSSSDPRVSSES